jgi:hypothetical protein
MSHPNLGDELLKAAGVTILPPEQQLSHLLDRGSRRMRRLTWIVMALWALTIPMVGMLIVFFWTAGSFNSAARSQYIKELQESKPNYSDRSPEQHAIARGLMIQAETIMAVGFLAAAIAVLGLLSLGTIILIHSSRKVTLRQIAVSLQTLSEQVRQLQSPSTAPDAH